MNDEARIPGLVLVGFAADTARVASIIGQRRDFMEVSADSSAEEIPDRAELVVFVWSEHTGWSTSLYAQFGHVERVVDTAERRVLFLDGSVRSDGIMPSFGHFSAISLQALRARVANE